MNRRNTGYKLFIGLLDLFMENNKEDKHPKLLLGCSEEISHIITCLVFFWLSLLANILPIFLLCSYRNTIVISQ